MSCFGVSEKSQSVLRNKRNISFVWLWGSENSIDEHDVRLRACCGKDCSRAAQTLRSVFHMSVYFTIAATAHSTVDASTHAVS
jgi:hypothetical protein